MRPILACLLLISAPAWAANYATCVLDKMPGAANWATHAAVLQTCSQEHPERFSGVKKGSGRGLFGFDDGNACTSKYRARRDERERQMMEHQMRLSQQQAAQAAAPRAQSPGDSPACKAARKELEFVSSIRTVSQNEKRMRTNAAISNVNAACGSNTQLMQEPAKIEVRPRHCIHVGGGMLDCD